jgi:hypothetical protein
MLARLFEPAIYSDGVESTMTCPFSRDGFSTMRRTQPALYDELLRNSTFDLPFKREGVGMWMPGHSEAACCSGHSQSSRHTPDARFTLAQLRAH